MRTLLQRLRFSYREWRKRPGLALTFFSSRHGVVDFDRRFRGFSPRAARFLD